MLLAMVCVLAGFVVAAPQARADTNGYRHQIVWNVQNLYEGDFGAAADDYREMISALRDAAGHTLRGQQLGATEVRAATDHRAVEIRMVNGQDVPGNSVASLYLRSNDLYLMGIWTPNGNGVDVPVSGLMAFNGMQREMQTIVQRATRVEYPIGPLHVGANYDALGSTRRTEVGMGGYALRGAIQLLQRYSRPQSEEAVLAMNGAYLTLIQATAEAARFESIATHVENNLRTYQETRLTREDSAMENQWNTLSGWLLARYRNEPGNGITFRGVHYATLNALLAVSGYIMAQGSR
ncbi:ribosome-inactivating family protein [Streptomyces chrestomyceticus]|uniref:ribosome-inactivating family protein n=1 Tax=Streptomyces chrestomyceticus TaxID=68185 RepID=UPI0035A8789E